MDMDMGVLIIIATAIKPVYERVVDPILPEARQTVLGVGPR